MIGNDTAIPRRRLPKTPIDVATIPRWSIRPVPVHEPSRFTAPPPVPPYILDPTRRDREAEDAGV